MQQPNALRSLSTVSFHKIVQIAGVAVTVAIIPRLFGAEDYGRFAFVLALTTLGQILADFGTLDVMGRFVPGMAWHEASRLYMQTLVFKVMAGILAGTITVAAALTLGEWMRLEWAVLTGLSVILHLGARVPFQLALGLNRVGTWMAEQAWRQWILFALLLVLLPWLSLTGALLAIVLMEAVFCILGWWWVRDHWQWREARFDWSYLRPYLRFGTSFFLSNLATVALYRSGPVLIELLTHQSAQIGFFNLALGLFLTAYVTLSQFAQSLIPSLGDFRSRGETEQMQQWLQNLIRYSWLVGWLGAVAVWLIADWAVPLVFGADFTPAAPALKWISVAIPLAALVWAGNIMATVVGRGRVKFSASLVALFIFMLAAVWLTPLYGAAGTSVALALSVGANVIILGLFLQPDFSLPWPMLFFSSLAGTACLFLIVNFGL